MKEFVISLEHAATQSAEYERIITFELSTIDKPINRSGTA